MVDTNLFKKLTKNVDGIHDGFVKTISAELNTTHWAVSPFGWLEYLGLALRGALEIGPVPAGWTMPESVIDQYRLFVDEFGVEFATHCYWARSNAKQKYAALLKDDALGKKAIEEQKYHSEAFKSGPFSDPLFREPLATYSAEGIAELLSIDFQHRYNFPPNLAPLFREFSRSTLISEYYVERRNVVLARAYKQLWVNRIKGPHENHVAKETMSRLERAMSRLKNDADRFDHDLLVYFLLGFAINGKYEPVTIYSQDDPDEILCRLAVFHLFMRVAWEEWKHVDGVGDLPVYMAARYRFVCSAGHIAKEITVNDLVRFLLDEGLLLTE